MAYTALPENLSHLFRQRFRWSSSLYRGIVWVTAHLPSTHPAYWVLTFQAVVVMCAFVAWGWLIVFDPIVNGNLHLDYIGYMFVLGYVRSLRYLGAWRRNQTTGQRLRNFMLSPLVVVLYMVLLTPTLYLAVFGVRERKWFTRGSVEVELDIRDLPDIVPVAAEGAEPAAIDLRAADSHELDLRDLDHDLDPVSLPPAGTGRRRRMRSDPSSPS